jgi:hypothetical protein
MFGLGGKSYKVDETDPRTRWATFSNALGRRFFDEPWPWGIGSPFDLSRLVRALSTGAVVREKLPDPRVFSMDFLTLPTLFSGGGVGDGEGPVVVGGPEVDA